MLRFSLNSSPTIGGIVDFIFAGVLSLILLAYLGYAMLNPEKF